MQVVDPNRESEPEVGAENRPASLPRRLAALLALIALLASAAVSSWWILSGQADFFAADRRRAPAAADEGHP
jgi:ferric-dicitrate binding protein FerR (iron transport regulator)